MNQVFRDDRFFIFIFYVSDISIFFKKHFFHTKNFRIPACKCVKPVVPMYYVSTCNEGGCGEHPVQKGSPHRKESVVSRQRHRPIGPLLAPGRSVAPRRSFFELFLWISSDALRPRPSMCPTSRFNPCLPTTCQLASPREEHPTPRGRGIRFENRENRKF